MLGVAPPVAGLLLLLPVVGCVSSFGGERSDSLSLILGAQLASISVRTAMDDSAQSDNVCASMS